MIHTINNWAIVPSKNIYQAPELASNHLKGQHENGKWIRTSAIVSIDDGIVKTKSGSLYKLGDVNEHYLEAYPDSIKLIDSKND